MTGCSILGCDSPHNSRGWCHRHYQRWLRHGDPNTDLRLATPLVCDCPTPQPTPTDECSRCRRVIAEAVHTRRAQR